MAYKFFKEILSMCCSSLLDTDKYEKLIDEEEFVVEKIPDGEYIIDEYFCDKYSIDKKYIGYYHHSSHNGKFCSIYNQIIKL